MSCQLMQIDLEARTRMLQIYVFIHACVFYAQTKAQFRANKSQYPGLANALNPFSVLHVEPSTGYPLLSSTDLTCVLHSTQLKE